MSRFVAAFFALAMIAGNCQAGDKQLSSEKDRINYSVGYQIGEDLKKQGVVLISETLILGIRDAISNTEPLLPTAEMHTILSDLKRKGVEDQKSDNKQAVENSLQRGRGFMVENARREGVTTLTSGVQYKVITKGTGKSPSLEDSVTVHFRSTLLNGREIDSTYRKNKPRTYPLKKAIPGLREVLPMMKEGAKWQIFIPAHLAFGARGPLDEQSMVIYEMELLSVQPAK